VHLGEKLVAIANCEGPAADDEKERKCVMLVTLEAPQTSPK
jgi:hypothetical protein